MPTDKLKPTIELVNKSQMFTASHTPILKQQYKAQLIIEFIGGGKEWRSRERKHGYQHSDSTKSFLLLVFQSHKDAT